MDNVYNQMTPEEKRRLKELLDTIKLLEFQLNSTKNRLQEFQTHIIAKYEERV